MQLVQTITLTSTATNMQFTSIPQTGKHLYLTISARSSVSAVVSTALGVYINDIATFTYNQRRLRGDGSNNNSGDVFGARPFDYMTMPGASATTNTFGNTEIYIPNYTASGTKAISCDSTVENNATACQLLLVAGTLPSAGAVTKIELGDISGSSFIAGSTASLYILN